MSGGGMGRPRRLGKEGEVGLQGGDDLFQNFFFGHGGWGSFRQW
jgi:hypothetical protein